MNIVVLLFQYAHRSFLTWLAWRSFAFTLAVNQCVPPLIGFAVWSAAQPGRTDLAVYYFSLIWVRLMTVSYENHTFSGAIYNGELSDDLLRPCPVVLKPLGENIAIRIWHLLIGLPFLLVASLFVPAVPSAIHLLEAIPALVLAAALQFLYTFILALSAFWTGKAHGIVNIGNIFIILLGGVAVPVGWFPEPVRAVAEVLPFRAMMGFPAEVTAGLLSVHGLWSGYALQTAWTIALLGLARFVWKRGIGKFTAVGG